MIRNRLAGNGVSRGSHADAALRVRCKVRGARARLGAALLPALALLACGGEPPQAELDSASDTASDRFQGGPVLDPTIEVVLSAVDSGSGKVQYVLSNHGGSSQRVLLRETAIAGTQAFEVRLDGEYVEYTGESATWAAPSAQDLVTLKAGEERTVTLDLTHKYDMSKPGTYLVRVLQLAGSTLSDPVQAESWGAPALNNGAPEIMVSVDAAHVRVPLDEVVDKAVIRTGACTATQKTTVLADEARATTFLDNINRRTLQLAGSSFMSATTRTLFQNDFGTTSQDDRSVIVGTFTRIMNNLPDNEYVCISAAGDSACIDASGRAASCCTVVHNGALAVTPNKNSSRTLLCAPYFEGTTTDRRATIIVHEVSHQNRSGLRVPLGTVDSTEVFNGVQVFFPNLHVAAGYEIFAPRCTAPSVCL